MSIEVPPKGWFHKPTGSEAVWIGVAFVWSLVMFAAMPYWHFKGKQTSLGESYRVSAGKFLERYQKFVKAYQVKDEKGKPLSEGGVPVVAPPPNSDIYMYGGGYQWHPVLKLKKGQTYRLHITSTDYQHGFSVIPININFHVLPGYDHVLTITPTQAGEYKIICNEYCGPGHHFMTGKIIVVE